MEDGRLRVKLVPRGSKSKMSILLLCLGAFVGFAARNLSLAGLVAACGQPVLSARRVEHGPPSRPIAVRGRAVEARGRTGGRKANSLLRRIDVATSQPRIGPQRRGNTNRRASERGVGSVKAKCRRNSLPSACTSTAGVPARPRRARRARGARHQRTTASTSQPPVQARE
jgi:hypothetical protein